MSEQKEVNFLTILEKHEEVLNSLGIHAKEYRKGTIQKMTCAKVGCSRAQFYRALKDARKIEKKKPFLKNTNE